MTTWSVGEVVNTLGSHPSIQGFEPPTDYHFFMRIKKESRAFFLKMFVCNSVTRWWSKKVEVVGGQIHTFL